MADRNDNRYVEDALVAFAMYCDENMLTQDERIGLAQSTGDSLEDDAASFEDDGS